MYSPDRWSGHQLFSGQAASVEKQAARCKRQRGPGFVLNPGKEAALTRHANTNTPRCDGEKRRKEMTSKRATRCARNAGFFGNLTFRDFINVDGTKKCFMRQHLLF